MKHTNISKIVYPTLIASKGTATVALTDVRQFDNKDITICPALILAIIRTVKVSGRINILIVSTTTKNGIKAFGAPLGVR